LPVDVPARIVRHTVRGKVAHARAISSSGGSGMRKLMLTLLAAAALAAGLGGGASAQQKGSSSLIAIVDTKLILEKAKAAIGAREQLGRIRATLQTSAREHQDEVNRLGQELARDRAMLSQDAFQQRMRDVMQKRNDYQRQLQEQQEKLEAASRTAAQKIETVVGEIVDEFKKERQYGLVVLRSATMGTPSVPDITQDVLGRLDRRLPRVDVVVN
jgi:Skp family chaperone for outer membrane proteins